jgi:hypothetical protein
VNHLEKREFMTSKTKIVLVLIFCLLLAGCQTAPTSSVKTSEPLTQEVLPTAVVVTATSAAPQVATVTEVPLPTATSDVSTPDTSAALPDYSSSTYVDDRSTPAGLVISYANALNRHEYIRAYSYWADEASTVLGTLDAYSAAFDSTDSVSVVLGKVSSEGAAGSVYYTLPTVLKQSLSDGSSTRTANCYVLRFPQPGNYGEPPISPMHFDQATTTTKLDASTSDADALTSACASNQSAGLNEEVPTFASVSDISASNYLDNRSGAVEVVSSLLNALNRKEYVRAYSYWQDTKVVGTYDSYAAGFADTDTVTAVFGTVASDAGAGQYNYQVPLAMIVKTTKNATQTFVGCYTLHLSNPGMQGTLPFEPLGITKGHFTKIANGTDVKPLLTTACN